MLPVLLALRGCLRFRSLALDKRADAPAAQGCAPLVLVLDGKPAHFALTVAAGEGEYSTRFRDGAATMGDRRDRITIDDQCSSSCAQGREPHQN